MKSALVAVSLMALTTGAAHAQFKDNNNHDYDREYGGYYDGEGRYRRNYSEGAHASDGRPRNGVDSEIDCKQIAGGRTQCVVSVDFNRFQVRSANQQGKTIITAGEAIDAAQVDWNSDDIARGAKLVDVQVNLDVFQATTVAWEYGTYTPRLQGQRPVIAWQFPNGWQGKFSAPGRPTDVPSGFVTLTNPGRTLVRMGGFRADTSDSITGLGATYRAGQDQVDVDYLNINLTPGAAVDYIDFVFEGPADWRMHRRGRAQPQPQPQPPVIIVPQPHSPPPRESSYDHRSAANLGLLGTWYLGGNLGFGKSEIGGQIAIAQGSPSYAIYFESNEQISVKKTRPRCDGRDLGGNDGAASTIAVVSGRSRNVAIIRNPCRPGSNFSVDIYLNYTIAQGSNPTVFLAPQAR